MSGEGTLVCLAFIAKQDKIFKASDVFASTGLERPLVYYHLNRFAENGWIEKVGGNYAVKDRSALVEAIAFGQKDTNTRVAHNTLIFKNGDALNRSIQIILEGKALDLAGSRELKAKLNEVIGDTIESLKHARRGLNTRSIKAGKARKHFVLKDYLVRCDYFGVEVDKELLEISLGSDPEE